MTIINMIAPARGTPEIKLRTSATLSDSFEVYKVDQLVRYVANR